MARSFTITQDGESRGFTVATGVGPVGPQGIQGPQGEASTVAGPQGDTGPTGPANALTVASVTTGAPGSAAAVSVGGTSPTQSLTFAIPRGDTGATGPTGTAATIAVGTVTTGAAGSSAAITNSGSTGAAVFDFAIPQGAQGIQGNIGATGPAFAGALATSSALTRTITRADLGPVLRCTNATSNTLTVTPYHVDTCPWAAGDIIMIRRATGAGALAWSNTGITINGDGLANMATNSTCAIQYVSTNLWDFI